MHKVRLNIAPRIIQNIASLYTDVYRVLMEYVDNSLDDVEQPGFYICSAGLPTIETYKREIEITVKIDGKTFKDGTVTITDNCNGIPKLKNIIQNLGNSCKRSSSFTNGQFGYGIFSFMSICGKMEITTKHTENKKAEYVCINSGDFEQDNIDNVIFNIQEIDNALPSTSGTKVVLSEFTNYAWRELNTITLNSEVEKHFEIILNRKGLKISVMDNKGKIYLCEPFKYSGTTGSVYDQEHTVKYNIYHKGKKIPTEYDPIHVKLMYTAGRALSRPPVFISRGRRIAEIRDIKSFSSDRKRDIWSHPNITGYIDLKQLLDPTIARTDYKNSDVARRIFGYIKNRLEPELLKFIEKNAKTHNKNDFSELESRINEELETISKDSLLKSTTLKAGDTVVLDENDGTISYHVIVQPQNQITTNLVSNNKFNNKNNGGSSEPKHEIQSPIKYNNKNSSINVKIDDLSEPILDSNGKIKRSELYNDTVILYKKHPDFESRIEKSSYTEDKISQSLITYIIAEVLVHYTCKYYDENKHHQNSKEPYIFLTSRLYRLERATKDLIGKSLNTFKKH